MKEKFAGRHLIMDVVVHDTDLLKCTQLADEYMYKVTEITDMQLVTPVLSMRFPFNSEYVGVVKKLEKAGVEHEIITEALQYVKDKEENDTGVSSVGIWNTSHCCSHSWVHTAYISIDLFSCKDYDINPVVDFTMQHYNTQRIDLCNMQRYIGQPQIIEQETIYREIVKI